MYAMLDHTAAYFPLKREADEGQVMKKTIRNVLVILAIIIAIIAVIFYLLVSNLDRVVASAIESFGTEALGAKVKVSFLRIQLSAGVGTIKELVVENPKGFSDKTAIRLGNIIIGISTDNLTGDAIIIEEIVIQEPSVLYEVSLKGNSNLGQIQSNMQKADARRSAEDHYGKNIAIRSLIIEEGTVLVRTGLPNQQPLTVATPRIELTNLGGESGTSQANIAREIAVGIAREASVKFSGGNTGGSVDDTFRSLIGR
jgi:uncharacterized protein involved in outer membrane biogenesis